MSQQEQQQEQPQTPRRYPRRNRRAPARLVVVMDDEVERYEVTRETNPGTDYLFSAAASSDDGDIDEAEVSDCDGEPSSDEIVDEAMISDELGDFVVDDIVREGEEDDVTDDEDYVPGESEDDDDDDEDEEMTSELDEDEEDDDYDDEEDNDEEEEEEAEEEDVTTPPVSPGTRAGRIGVSSHRQMVELGSVAGGLAVPDRVSIRVPRIHLNIQDLLNGRGGDDEDSGDD